MPPGLSHAGEPGWAWGLVKQFWAFEGEIGIIAQIPRARGVAQVSAYKAFPIGVAGAFVVYYLLYRETRFLAFIQNPRQNWRVLVFDLVVYLVCGGLVTLFLVEPKTAKDAFIGGCAWQGLVGGALAGTELKALKKG